MSSHNNDTKKIELKMVELNLQKNDKSLPMIASQDLSLPLKYVKKLISEKVSELDVIKERIKIDAIWDESRKNN